MRGILVSEKYHGIKSDSIIYCGLAKYRGIPSGCTDYPCDAMLSRVSAVVVCPSVSLSVRLSHASIVQKRLNIASCKQCCMIAQGL